MKRLVASLLVLGLATGSTSVFAQSSYGRYDDGSYRGSGANSGDETYYDYAQVIRVDPVLDGSYSETSSYRRRCYDTTTTASGYGNGGYGNDDDYYRDDGRYRNDGAYDDYGRRSGGSEAGRNMATIVGGIAGAVLGSKVGNGSGSVAAAAVGSMLGGMAGREVYNQNQRNKYPRQGTVRVCEPEPVRDGYGGYRGDTGVSAYDVTYEYNGRRYTRRMDYHPGDRVRVRVDVMPQ